MKISHVATIVLVWVVLSTPLFGQSSNATVGGTVADPSGALIPGVTITATNNATGVVTTVISNDAGAYNFASLLPGLYKISAALPGFQTQTYSDVQLGNAAQVRLNFTLTVASVAQSVEVSVAAQNLITSSSSSVGEVLPQQTDSGPASCEQQCARSRWSHGRRLHDECAGLRGRSKPTLPGSAPATSMCSGTASASTTRGGPTVSIRRRA